MTQLVPRLAGLEDRAQPHLWQPSFPAEEYQQRLWRVQTVMEGFGLDFLLVHSAASICYLTGFESVLWYKYALVIVPRQGSPVLLAQDFEMPNACALVWTEDRVTYPCHGDPIMATVELLRNRGWIDRKLGIELTRWSLSAPVYAKLCTALGKNPIDATALLDRIKREKSSQEIAVLRRAARITTEGMVAALEAVQNGRTDNDVAVAAYSALIGGGSEYMAIDPIVTVGSRSSIPHSTHRRVPIGQGEAVLIEVGACVHRYSAACMRSALTAPVPDLGRRMAEACRASVDEVIKNMRPGAVADDIARRADRVIGEFSKQYVWHGYYGYSLGIGFPPDWNDTSAAIVRGGELVLQSGMVFHVSTSLRKVGVCGVAFSETVMVTDRGSEVLTSVPPGLKIAS